MKNEVQVNIKDLIIYIVKQWKLYVVAGVIGAVLLCGVYAVKSYSDFGTGSIGDEQKIESLKSTLTEEEAGEVEEAVDLYLTNMEQYKKLKTYAVNSLLHQIDATNTPTYRMVYRVNGTSLSQDEEIGDEMLALLLGCAKKDSTAETLKSTLGLETDNVYIKELITVESVEMSNCITVTVVAPEKELCKGIAVQLQKIIGDEVAQMGSMYQALSVEIISEAYYVEMNHIVQTMQFDIFNRLNNTNTLLGKSYYDFTASQESYFDALVEEAETSEETEEGTTVKATAPAKSISSYIKFAILGAIAGVFVAIVYAFMKYLLTDTLKTKEDLSKTYGQHVFCQLSAKEIGKESDAFALLKENLKFAGGKHSVQKLLIAGATSEEGVQKVKEILGTELKESFAQIDVITIKKDDAEAVSHINGCDGVVFVEQIGKSSYTNIEKEIHLCHYYEVPVLGFVVMK